MMEVSSSVKMEEDENELSLELSIGRKCYKKTTPLPQKSIDFTTQQESICRSSSKMIISPRSQLDSAVELPLKREILALRRQEARKKREEKIMRFKSTSSCIGGGGGKNGNVCCVINQEDNAVDDEDDEAEMPPRKKERSQSSCHDNNVVVGQKEQEQQEELVVRDLNLMMDDHASSFKVQSSYSSLPAMQYVPFTNGIVYHPHGVIPSCLGSVVACTNGLLMEKDKRVSFGNIVGGNEGPEKDKRVSFDTEACRSFRPYSRRNVDIIKSDGSSGPSSSAVSDHHKSSLQGGGSSINFPQESQNTSSAGNGPKKSEIKCWDSMGMGSNEVKVKTKANPTVNMASSTHIQAIESMCSEEPKPAAPPKEPILSTKNPIHPALSNKETSNGVITNNPLKSQPGCNGALPLPQMPCVSTTGNGPDGKTITGFLYRYTKTEVCIVCVCHGTSFSPAEFVNHAGGVDVEHPLRHITIVPSDLA